MANPSSLYAEDTSARQTLANGAVVKWTKQLQNIHALNSETDLSIAYTNWANEPMMTRANRGFHQWQGGCVSGGDLGYNQSTGFTYQHASGIKQLESGQPRIDSLQTHVVLSNGGGYYVWGYNPESTTRISGGSGDQRRYLLDMDINKMLFSCTITVVDKSFFDNVDYATNPENMPAPSEHAITLKELYTHPELYYCTGSINWGNTYVYGEDTSDHWRGVVIRPSIILTGESIGEYQGADDSIFGRFNSNGSFSYDSRDPNAHANFGGGGSSNTLYNRMNAGYFMGCNNEIDMTPTDTFDSAGGMSTAIALAKWGNTNFNRFAYCNGQIFDYGDSVIWCAWGCRVANNTDTGAIYRDYIFGTRRYIKADKMLKYIASFGLYFMSESFDPDTVSLTPETLGDDSRIMLGEMIADGTTTGRWITDIDSYTGPNKDGKTSNPDYDPSGGGGGGDGDDESDDQSSGGIYGGAQGMCNLYYMTAGEIKDLQNWFRGTVFAPGIQIPADFDPSNQLIGLMAFPIELGGSVDSTTITFRTADNQAVDTGVSCQKAYGDDLKFDLGTIDIPARMQQRGVPFLDYSCQVEVYIPFCDVVQLDVQQVIGTTLKCEMWISPATGDVSAMLSSGTHPVAYTSGNCAQQLPISVSSYGAIAGAKLAAQNRNTQAVFQAAQNVVKDITNTGAIGSAISNHTAVNGQGLVEFSRIPQVQNNTGLAVGAGIKAAGTMVNTALQLTAQNFDNRYALQVAKNSAPTHVSGSFGACTSWHFPNYCYVKITRPHFQKPDNYGHTEAVPVVATKSLSSLTGLTTCVNPDVSSIGTATMQELETIKSYLMSGVIL